MTAAHPVEPPTDPAEFDRWARATTDRWDFSSVQRAVRPILADPDADPELRAVAAVWLTDSDPAHTDLLRALSHDREVSPDTSARVAALLSRKVSGDGDQAVAVCERADEDARSAGIGPQARAVLGRALAESLVAARRPDEAQEVLDALRQELDDEPDLASWAALGLVHAQLVISTSRRAVLLREGDPGLERQAVDRMVADHARKVIATATELGPIPIAVAARIDSSSVLVEIGEVAEAIVGQEAVSAEVAPIDGAWSAHYRALIALADTHVSDERHDRAVEAQERAIEVAEAHRSTALVGLGRQGLARHLRALGRLDEASEQFGLAAELIRSAGGVVESFWLRLERSEVHLALEDPQRAGALAESVLAELATVQGMPAEVAHRLEVSARQASVGALLHTGDLAGATQRLIELADLERRTGGSGAAPRSAAGVTAARSRNWDGALALLAQAADEARAGAAPGDELGVVSMAYTTALEVARDRDQAREMATAGLAVAREAAHPAATGRLAGMLGSVHLDGGDPLEAEEVLRVGLSAAQEGDEDALARMLHRDLARALDLLGRSDEAEAHRRAGDEGPGRA